MQITKPPHSQALLPSSIHIIKQTTEITISDPEKLLHLIKTNSRTLTNLTIPHLLSNTNPLKTPIFQKILHLFHHEKLASTLHFTIQPTTLYHLNFSISTLKNLHGLTALNLQLSAFKFSTPKYLKSLFISLTNSKKLISLSLTISMNTPITPHLISTLSFAFNRLQHLRSLSLTFYGISGFNYPSLTALSSCLSKLSQLKSLALSMENCSSINSSALSVLAPVLQNMLALQTLSITLFNAKKVQSRAIQTFFASLKDLKNLKNFTFDLGKCEIDTPDPDPISQGLLLSSKSSPLETIMIRYHANSRDNALEKLAGVLQSFPSLKDLRLDLSENSLISDKGLSKLSLGLQNLQSLYSLQLKLSHTTRLASSVKIIGNAIKSLNSLKSLSLDFAWNQSIDDSQIVCFSASLQGLTQLKQLNLDFAGLAKVSDKGLSALANSLKPLVCLENLQLNLASLRMMTNKGLLDLSCGLTKLEKLTFLSINLNGDRSLSREGIDGLGIAFENMNLLEEVYFSFDNCHGMKTEEENFEVFFKSLGELKKITKITVNAPWSEAGVYAAQKIQHVKDCYVSWSFLES